MFVSLKSRTIFIFTIIIIILEGDTKRPNLKEGILPVKRDYRPSKWVANSAMDVWYGNKSMIDVISREFSDVMYKLTARPVRSASQIPTADIEEEIKTDKVPYTVSRIEINFIDADNQTVHTVQLQPMKKLGHPIKSQVEPTKLAMHSTEQPVNPTNFPVHYKTFNAAYKMLSVVNDTSSVHKI